MKELEYRVWIVFMRYEEETELELYFSEEEALEGIENFLAVRFEGVDTLEELEKEFDGNPLFDGEFYFKAVDLRDGDLCNSILEEADHIRDGWSDGNYSVDKAQERDTM